MPAGDYHQDKHVFRHHLTPERDEGLDVGLVDRRFDVIRCRELQADIVTAGGIVSAVESTGVVFGDGAGLLDTDAANFSFNDSTNTLAVVNIDAGALTLDTPLPLTEGGTGATTASAARTNLGAAATSHVHAAVDITSGTIATARLGSGTPTSTTFLRGDQTWAAPAGTPAGIVSAFAGSAAPTGYLMCDGAAVSRTTFADLFTIISTTYGAGDGSTTFNVPDLRGRTAFGKASSGTFQNLAATGGAETASLPNHVHTMAHTHTLNGGTDIGAGTADAFQTSTGQPSSANTGNPTTSPTLTVTNPFLVLNYIIKT